MNSISMTFIEEEIRSGQVERQALALDQVASLVKSVTTEAVGAISGQSNRLILAERLSSFRTAMVEPMKEAFVRTSEPEAKSNLALLLLDLGERVGIDWLIGLLATPDEYSCLAAIHLSRNGIREAADAMVTRLRQSSPDETDIIDCFASALRGLGVLIPDDVRARFMTPDAPRELIFIFSRP